jgi:hypothetical protein
VGKPRNGQYQDLNLAREWTLNVILSAHPFELLRLMHAAQLRVGAVFTQITCPEVRAISKLRESLQYQDPRFSHQVAFSSRLLYQFV